MKNILIASYDLEIGGVERSLISMLEQFDYDNYNVDVLLYRHQGEFMPMLTKKVNLLKEIPEYATFRKSIGALLKGKNYAIATSRIFAKLQAEIMGKLNRIAEPGYYQMQLMWKYAMPFLPEIEKEYDVAISYLWPHNFVAEKVKAKKKIAWVHTDFSAVKINEKSDNLTWSNFDLVIAVSEACRNSILNKYPALKNKLIVLENVISTNFIKKMSRETIENPLKNDNRFKLVTIARLSHAKGIDNAIKGLKILINKGYSDLVWYVVGYGGDEEKLRELILKLNLTNNFILLGKKVNPYPFLNEADIYVQPSRYEGKAVTVTEAQVLGKAIIITDYPTASSQLENNTEGLICENNPKGIADCIEWLYKNASIRRNLQKQNEQRNYENKSELEKLFSFIN